MKSFSKILFISIVAVCLIVMINCSGSGQSSDVDVSLLPMYGMTEEYGGHKKTPEQIQADRLFLQNSDQSGVSREEACEYYLTLAWEHIEGKNDAAYDLDMAMRRTNQAWQLDGLNQRVYVTFAHILSLNGDTKGTIDFLERGIAIDQSYVSIYEIYLNAALDIFLEDGDITFLERTITLIDQVNPTANNLEEKDIEKLKKIKEDAELYIKTKPH